MKKYLFVLRHAPYHGLHAQEMLDVILTVAAFEQHVALLILDDAVFQLKQSQQTQKKAYKNLGAVFKALEIYDVNDIYVETESLVERGLSANDLLLPTQGCSRHNIPNLMQQYDLIFSA
ncbi:MAG: sulfurtransferase complex subunit TusC [Methylococcales bacterium]|nr:sulfurtransferase complex subunit TusC [Methylococcales bacterium]